MPNKEEFNRALSNHDREERRNLQNRLSQQARTEAAHVNQEKELNEKTQELVAYRTQKEKLLYYADLIGFGQGMEALSEGIHAGQLKTSLWNHEYLGLSWKDKDPVLRYSFVINSRKGWIRRDTPIWQSNFQSYYHSPPEWSGMQGTYETKDEGHYLQRPSLEQLNDEFVLDLELSNDHKDLRAHFTLLTHIPVDRVLFGLGGKEYIQRGINDRKKYYADLPQFPEGEIIKIAPYDANATEQQTKDFIIRGWEFLKGAKEWCKKN